MKKSNIQVFLASLLAAAVLTCPASALSFPDVDSNSGDSTAIGHVSELGIMVGDTQGNFNPDKIVSRAEMATIVCRVLNQAENLPTADVFTDVPATHWANACVGKASELGIVGGYGDGIFGPSDPVTYEQAVTMIVRAIGEGDKASSYGSYPDGFLQVAQERNLLKGIQAERGQGLSRSSVAVLLYNYYTAAPGDSHVHSWATRHIDEVGHYESIGVHTVVIQYCDCGEVFPLDTPENIARWQAHKNPLTGTCRKNYIQETLETATEKQYVVDTPAHDEAYCTICGAIQ